MKRQISIKLDTEEYEELMNQEGETITDKIKQLINSNEDTENNYLIQHCSFKAIGKYTYQEQTFIAMGALLVKLFPDEVPEKIRKTIIPKFNKGEILPLFKEIEKEALKHGNKYDDIMEFIGGGLLLNNIDPTSEDIGYLRVLGESLARYFDFEEH